jgi:uncharacterized protein DUF4154
VIRRVALAVALALAAARAAAQDTPPAPEQAVKAAYLLSFTRYVEWPAGAFPDSAAPVNICVVGDAALTDVVRLTIEGRRSRGRPVRLLRPDAPEHVRDCHLVFLPSQIRSIDGWLASLRTTSALTVGEGTEFLQRGGMVSLVIREQNIRFLINDEAARAAGLRISSRLLALAVRSAAGAPR